MSSRNGKEDKDKAANEQVKEDKAFPPEFKYDEVSRITNMTMGGVAGMVASAILQPLDVVKVRLQLYNKPCSTVAMVQKIAICEGCWTFWTGLGAGCMRQATYTTTRFYVADWLQEKYRKKYAKKPDFSEKLLIGVMSSIAGAFAGCPSEVALIRLMGDRPRVPCSSYNCPRRYYGTMHAIFNMVASAILQPLDVVKVRLQLYNKPCSTVAMVQKIAICEGCWTFWTGLGAGCMRQATYTTTRFYVADWLQEKYRKKYAKKPDFSEKLLIGVMSSIAGAFAGCPSEVALIRLMGDRPRVPCSSYNCPRRYYGTMHAIFKIARYEGVTGLWRGGTMTILRAVCVNSTQLAIYPMIRDEVKLYGMSATGYKLHIYTTIITNFITSVISFPVDVVKTRFQEQRNGISFKQAISDVMKYKELNFTKGFLPYYIRMVIHTSLTYFILEETVKYYNQNSYNS